MLTKKELKKKNKDYQQGYKDGIEAWDCGHSDDPNDMVDDNGNSVSSKYYDGYWDGFYDAQEDYNNKIAEE